MALQALNEAAFSPALAPEGLWRAGCAWASQGLDEQGEWLQEMAATLADIVELPLVDLPYDPDDFGF